MNNRLTPSARSILFAWLLSAPLAAQHKSPWATVQEEIAADVARWGVPGVAVAVVHKGAVVWKSAFGVKRAGFHEPVDTETVFDIGSISKTFTAVAAMHLAEDKALDLAAPAVDLLDGLKFSTDALNKAVTVPDMLSHRTGLPGNNMMFWGTDLTRSEVIGRVRYLRATAPVGQRFQYQNVMYSAVGEIVGATSNSSWDAFVAQRIFAPLGMRRTRASRPAAKKLTNQAHPHQLRSGKWTRIPYVNLHNCGPAGSIVSCVDDMAQWVRLLLGRGSLGDTKLVSETGCTTMWRSHVTIPPTSVYRRMAPLSKNHGYGLGFFVHEYRGHKIIEHGGQSDGMHALLFLVPGQGAGVVVLTNALHVMLPHAIAYRAIGRLLSIDPKAAVDACWNTWNAMKGRMQISAFQLPAGVQVVPAALRQRIAGDFQLPLYGTARVAGDGEELRLRLLGFDARMHFLGGGRFTLEWLDADAVLIGLAATGATFVPGDEARADVLRLRALGSFTRSE